MTKSALFAQLRDAVLHADVVRVKSLLAHKIDLNGYERDESPLLELAVHKGSEEIVQALLDAGADPNGQAWDGHTALMIAAQKDNISMAKTLVRAGARLDVCLNDRDTLNSLIVAAKFNSEQVLDFLIKEGADVNFATDHGLTALHAAVMLYDNDRIVKTLLDRGANPKALTNDGWSALDYALMVLYPLKQTRPRSAELLRIVGSPKSNRPYDSRPV